jgi:hypothetical protein
MNKISVSFEEIHEIDKNIPSHKHVTAKHDINHKTHIQLRNKPSTTEKSSIPTKSFNCKEDL